MKKNIFFTMDRTVILAILLQLFKVKMAMFQGHRFFGSEKIKFLSYIPIALRTAKTLPMAECQSY